MVKLLAIRHAETPTALVQVRRVNVLPRHGTGDPIALLFSVKATEAKRVAMIAALGLDRPVAQQCLTVRGSALQGDFGQSVTTGRADALHVVVARLPAAPCSRRSSPASGFRSPSARW